jgi:hypothetical protein
MCGYRAADGEQCGYGDLDETGWGLGRAIALWRFIAVQQFCAGPDTALRRKVLIVELALMAYSLQIALPNRTAFSLPAKRV